MIKRYIINNLSLSFSYNDLEEINKLSIYKIEEDMLIPKSTYNSYVHLISNIELKANHQYLLFGFYRSTISFNIHCLSGFSLDEYERNVDYRLLFNSSPSFNMLVGGGALCVYIIQALKDIKAIYQLWNYVSAEDYSVAPQVAVIRLK